MTIKFIPNEVYYTACEYANIDITIEELKNAKDIYNNSNTQSGFELPKAIYDYMTLQNNFDEEDGKFNYINGYILE